MKLQDLAIESQKIARVLRGKAVRKIKLSDSIREAIYNGASQNELRHDYTNWESEVLKFIDEIEDTDVRAYVYNEAKKKVNNKIDELKTELLILLLAHTKSLEERAVKAENKLAKLQNEFQNMLKYNVEVNSKLRAELANAILSKEQYVSFIADLCDCTYEDALAVGY